MNEPTMLLLSAVAVSSMGAFAQHALATGQGVGAVPTTGTQSLAQSSTTLSLRGIIEKGRCRQSDVVALDLFRGRAVRCGFDHSYTSRLAPGGRVGAPESRR